VQLQHKIEYQQNNIKHSDGLPEKQMLTWAGWWSPRQVQKL